jgi:DmsE family decaheme c-type cytochrome
MMSRKKLSHHVWNGLLLLLSLFFLVGAKALMLAADKKALPNAAVQTSSYVGSEVCKSCHEDLYKEGFARTAHVQIARKDGHGCESCHGPGAEHVSGGGDAARIIRFGQLTASEASARCLECHGDSHGQAQFRSSAHLSNDVGCLDCHSPHRSKEQHLLVKSQPELCYGCHGASRADFAKPFHHRVNERLVECNDCHNVHGSAGPRQTRSASSGDAVCFKCHADKQGPFVFEHVPVKTEGCSSCHTPHGSTNPRLLRVSQVNLLCLQCHTTPAAPPIGPAHNQSQKYQACTMCHPMIHGSNASRVLMK